jgi:hypothetical protein
MFVHRMQTKYIGYLNTTTRDLLDHLYVKYAHIPPADLQANDVNFKSSYDQNLPIETLFDQIENSVDYAAAGLTPYSPEQVVAIAYQLVFATGMFLDYCKTWKRRANFKVYFSSAHRKFHKAKTVTAGATGYQSANFTTQPSLSPNC